MAGLNRRSPAGVFHLTAMINVYTFRRMASFGAAAGLAAALAFPTNIDARQAAAQATCRITGRATSGQQPLPGVAIAIKSGTALKAATSTDQDGTYGITLTPGQYVISAELTGFSAVEQTITVASNGSSGSDAAAPDRCSQTLNIPMALAPRRPLPAAAASSPANGPTQAPAQTTAAANGGRGAQP